MPPPDAFGSVLEGALAILREPDPHAKAALAEQLAAHCRALPLRPPNAADAAAAAAALAPPDKPARLELPTTDPSKAGRRGRGGTADSRAKMLHALVHIESWAVDLAADLVARFAAAAAAAAAAPPGPDADPTTEAAAAGGGGVGGGYPRALAEDFCLVAADEARHFRLLERRLREVHPEGKGYGCFPVHDGLWESAERTARSLPARLAVEHCTHEARGLDVLPTTIARFRSNGDAGTADLLEQVVYGEEIAHCAAGVRWITFLWARAAKGESEEEATRQASAAAGPAVVWSSAVETEAAAAEQGADKQNGGNEDGDVEDASSVPLGRPAGVGEEDWRAEAREHASPARWFRSLVARNFYGSLRPPFNEVARAKAGFTREWYAPEEEAEWEGGEKDGDEAAAARAGAGAEDDARPQQPVAPSQPLSTAADPSSHRPPEQAIVAQ